MFINEFDKALLNRIILLHDETLNELPEDSLSLYESSDAVMWDGYILPVLELNEAINTAFRFNSGLVETDITSAFAPNGIENLNLAQLGYVFRDILVNEKFHQGLFARVIMDGRLGRLVKRLKEVVASEG